MSEGNSTNMAMAILVAIVFVEAGALAMVWNGSVSDQNELDELSSKAEASQYLLDVSAELQQELVLIDQATVDAAIELQGKTLDGEGVNAVLQDVVNTSSNIVSVLTTDANGTILTIQPSEFSSIIGMDIGYQDTMKVALGLGHSGLSQLDWIVQGYYAVYMAYPIFDDEGRINGSITSMFRPDWMVGNITDGYANDDPGVMVLQEDGVILFDADPGQIGKGTFTDSLFDAYPEIRSIAHRMVNESSGIGTYSFTSSGEEVRKEVTWTTVGVLGVQWTVSVIRAI